jgi:NADH-quinone oxidoreductase subunit J
VTLVAGLPVSHAGPGFGHVTVAEVVFGCLGVLALASALLVVTTRNVIHAALWLVVTLGALAGCYLVLTAEFVAWVQVLIYVGAVVVLLLFGAMLTRAPIGPAEQVDSPNKPLAVLVGLAGAVTLVVLMVAAFRSAYIDLHAAAGGGSGRPVGTALFRYWVLPFEVASVLLLAALVGAIVLSRRDVGAGGTGEVR